MPDDTDYIPAAERRLSYSVTERIKHRCNCGRCINCDFGDGTYWQTVVRNDSRVGNVIASHAVADSVARELAAALRELCDIYPDGMDDARAALARFDATIGQGTNQ